MLHYACERGVWIGPSHGDPWSIGGFILTMEKMPTPRRCIIHWLAFVYPKQPETPPPVSCPPRTG